MVIGNGVFRLTERRHRTSKPAFIMFIKTPEKMAVANGVDSETKRVLILGVSRSVLTCTTISY